MQSKYLLLNKKQEESVTNVYELPSTKQIVRYLYACAGFPTKTEWLKAIKARNFATWPHLKAKAVRKHFPEPDETAQGHMKNVKQGIRSTKKERPRQYNKQPEEEIELTGPIDKEHDIFLKIENSRRNDSSLP